MTVLSFPVAPFLHEWSPSATIPRPTAKMDKLICLGWMFEKQKGGELGTGFLRRTSYEVLNKAHILEMRRLPRNTSKWKKKIHRETEGKMELLEEKRADWGKPQGRWQPWVPLKLPDSLLQQHGHAWWWQAQRERALGQALTVREWKTALFLNHQRNTSKAGVLILHFQTPPCTRARQTGKC